ncbi:histamine N-methyltransferase-like isoform X2 [Scyliorhinus torazame]|uniref:histamine N-methyltransferase-like isoform X2 n=1 Tax=Scyliorhinus torazame TaxID=75743 RepID=UPI003B58F540
MHKKVHWRESARCSNQHWEKGSFLSKCPGGRKWFRTNWASDVSLSREHPPPVQIHTYLGQVDFEMLGKIQSQHPGLYIHNEVVELNPQQISKYKELVKEKGQGLNISFAWNQMSLEEYVKQNKERKESKKFDFIHMIEVLYFVESIHDTIKYFHSLLETNGKLLIIHTADDSGFHSLWEKVISRLPNNHLFSEIYKTLEEMRMKYQIYKLSSDMDITECFIERNENGERLLDFLTQIVHFSKTAPADLKDEVLHYLRQLQCSREENGKIIFNNNLHAVIVEC